MGSISIVTDKQLKKLKGKFNPNAFKFLIVSQDLHIRRKAKKGQETNIVDVSTLMPPNELAANLVNGKIDLYKQHYLEYLVSERQDVVAVIIKAVFEHDEDVVLVCTHDEYEDFLYLELLAQYIELEYKFEVYLFKKLVKKGKVPSYQDDKGAEKRFRKAIEKANHIVSYREKGKKKKKDKEKGKKKDKDKKKKKKK